MFILISKYFLPANNSPVFEMFSPYLMVVLKNWVVCKDCNKTTSFTAMDTVCSPFRIQLLQK